MTVKVEVNETVVTQHEEHTVSWKSKNKKLVIFAKQKKQLGVSRAYVMIIKKSSSNDIINLKASLKKGKLTAYKPIIKNFWIYD
jgi:hypothetical protein